MTRDFADKAKFFVVPGSMEGSNSRCAAGADDRVRTGDLCRVKAIPQALDFRVGSGPSASLRARSGLHSCGWYRLNLTAFRWLVAPT